MKDTYLLGLPISLENAVSPVSQAQARGMLRQVADYWKLAAQGRLVIDADAAPIYKSTALLPIGHDAALPDGNCNLAAWKFCNDAFKAARVQGYNGTPCYFTPHVSCRGHGLATVNTPLYMNGGLGLQLIAHEAGHHFGLRHSGSLKMAGARPFDPTAPGNACVWGEYGDPFCVMGTGLSYLCPTCAQRVGVRPAPKRIPLENRLMYVKATGAADDTEAPRAVAVTREGPTGWVYHLTYQSPTSLEQQPVVPRVVVVRLINAAGSYFLKMLQPGKSWIDPLGGVSFKNEGPLLGATGALGQVRMVAL